MCLFRDRLSFCLLSLSEHRTSLFANHLFFLVAKQTLFAPQTETILNVLNELVCGTVNVTAQTCVYFSSVRVPLFGDAWERWWCFVWRGKKEWPQRSQRESQNKRAFKFKNGFHETFMRLANGREGATHMVQDCRLDMISKCKDVRKSVSSPLVFFWLLYNSSKRPNSAANWWVKWLREILSWEWGVSDSLPEAIQARRKRESLWKPQIGKFERMKWSSHTWGKAKQCGSTFDLYRVVRTCGKGNKHKVAQTVSYCKT